MAVGLKLLQLTSNLRAFPDQHVFSAANVPKAFSVRTLSDHHHRYIMFCWISAVSLRIEVAGGGQGAYPFENRTTPLNKVITRGALPFDGKAPALVPKVVRALPREQHPGAAS